jgi:hypothetical protein
MDKGHKTPARNVVKDSNIKRIRPQRQGSLYIAEIAAVHEALKLSKVARGSRQEGGRLVIDKHQLLGGAVRWPFLLRRRSKQNNSITSTLSLPSLPH